MADRPQDDGIEEISDDTVKYMISRYTIFNFKSNQAGQKGFKLSMFPFVGVMVALITLIIGLAIYLIADNIGEMSPFSAVLLVAAPIVLYGFRTTGGLMRISDRLNPYQTDVQGPAGLMVPLFITLFVYGIYWQLGSVTTLYMVPALEIAVALSAVSVVFFCKSVKDPRFKADSGASGFITATIISVVAGVALAGLGMLVVDVLEIRLMIEILAMFAVAILFGYLLSLFIDKMLGGLDKYSFGAVFDISRPLIALVFVILFFAV